MIRSRREHVANLDRLVEKIAGFMGTKMQSDFLDRVRDETSMVLSDPERLNEYKEAVGMVASVIGKFFPEAGNNNEEQVLRVSLFSCILFRRIMEEVTCPVSPAYAAAVASNILDHLLSSHHLEGHGKRKTTKTKRRRAGKP